MNKNTLLAFALILGAFLVFSSQTYQRFYYNKILKQPYTADVVEKQKKEEQQTPVNITEKTKTKEIIGEIKNPVTINTVQNERDTIIRKADTIWVETEKLIIGISEIGAKVISLQTKEYRRDHIKTSTRAKDSGDYVDLIPKN